MTIYLTEPKKLTAGLWWARQITGDRDLGRGPWCIIHVAGSVPFLKARAVLVHYEPNDWCEPERSAAALVLNPNEWEFGPQIEILSDKDWAEWRPVAVERKP